MHTELNAPEKRLRVLVESGGCSGFQYGMSFDEPKADDATFESEGVVLPNPQAHVLVDAVPYGFVWCASDYIDSCTLRNPSLVWHDPAQQKRYREIVSQVRAWDAELPYPDSKA